MSMHDEVRQALGLPTSASYEECLEALGGPAKARVEAVYQSLETPLPIPKRRFVNAGRIDLDQKLEGGQKSA